MSRRRSRGRRRDRLCLWERECDVHCLNASNFVNAIQSDDWTVHHRLDFGLWYRRQSCSRYGCKFSQEAFYAGQYQPDNSQHIYTLIPSVFRARDDGQITPHAIAHDVALGAVGTTAGNVFSSLALARLKYRCKPSIPPNPNLTQPLPLTGQFLAWYTLALIVRTLILTASSSSIVGAT